MKINKLLLLKKCLLVTPMLALGGTTVLVSGCSDTYTKFINKITTIIKTNNIQRVYQAIFLKNPTGLLKTLSWVYVPGTQNRTKTDFTINGKFTFTFRGKVPDQKVTKKIILNIKDSIITFA